MAIVADTHPYVVGVDTHAASHTFAVLVAATGAVLDSASFPATHNGMKRMLERIGRRTGGDLDTLVVIEGIGSYGAQIARAAQQAGYQVVEAPATNTAARRGVGKSDELDAQLIARSVLGLLTDRLRQSRQADGPREAMRILLASRDRINTTRTSTINALTALARIHDLGIDARHSLSSKQIAQIAAWRPRKSDDLALATARREAVRLARAIATYDNELSDNARELTALVKASPGAHIMTETGLGPVNAAVVLTVWSHPGRIHSEAAFALIAGVSPLPASSGNTTRHRLNRSGDRRLNQALHSITVNRMIHDPRTRDYVARKRADGRTIKEIRRSLKRYIARHLYRLLNNPPTTPIAA